MTKSKLQVVITSTREGRQGPVVATWFANEAREQPQFEVELVDLAEFKLPVFDEPNHPVRQEYTHEATKAWAAKVNEADAFVFVIPEYDYFAPASLINALQYLAKEWSYKPVGFVSYGGISGGLRSVQSVKPLVTSLKMMPIPEGVIIPFFAKYITDGVFVPDEIHQTSRSVMLNELARWTEAMKTLRA